MSVEFATNLYCFGFNGPIYFTFDLKVNNRIQKVQSPKNFK